MWTDGNRGRYVRSKLRYPSDLTNEEWALIKPEIPRAKRGGNKRPVNVREVVNGLMYVLSTGPSGAHSEGLTSAKHDQPLLLPLAARRHAGPAASCPLRPLPRACEPRGESDRGEHRQPKRQEHRKGAAGLIGRLMEALVHAADIQDRDGGVMLMASLFGLYPFLLKLYADSGYQGPKFQQALARVCRGVNVEIVRRCDTAKFVVLPPR